MRACPMHDLANPDIYLGYTYHSIFAQLRNNSPVSWQEDPRTGIGYWAITKREHIDFVARNPKLFSSAARSALYDEFDDNLMAFMRSMVINMDPPEHSRIRRIVRKAFTPSAIELLEPRLTEICSAIVSSVIGKGRCEFVKEVACQLPLKALSELLGIPDEHRPELFYCAERMFANEDPDITGEGMTGEQAYFSVLQYARKFAEKQATMQRTPLVNMLLSGVEKDEGVDLDEFSAFFLMLFVAGNVTTRSAIANGMRLFIEHPDQYKKLQDYPHLIHQAVEEILRFETPVIQHRRTATCDVMVGECQIRKGDKVVMFFLSANHDEDIFMSSNYFDIERINSSEHRSFGSGEHICIGASLARLEMVTIFREIIKKINDPRQIGEAIKLRSNMFNSLKELHIEFDLVDSPAMSNT